MNYVTDDGILVLGAEQVKRRHGRTFDAVVEDAVQVVAARFAFTQTLAGRCEFENALTEVARVRVDPRPCRSAAIAVHAVAMQAIAPIDHATRGERLAI